MSEEEQIFYTEDDDETEEQILQRKRVARDHPANQLPGISFEKFTTYKSDYNKLSTLKKLSYTNSIAVEQNNNVILQQLRLKILKESYSETILLQDNRYQHYCRQMDRLSVMDEIITRQYFDERDLSNTIKCYYPNIWSKNYLNPYMAKRINIQENPNCSLKFVKNINILASLKSLKNVFKEAKFA